MEWIKCSDRMPRDHEVVLVLDYSQSVNKGYWFDSEKMWWGSEWMCEEGDVTHWMPLPEPPKEEE